MGAEEDRRQGPALRGLQGRAVLPALRHGAVEPRGRARLQGRRRPVASTCGCRSPRTAGRCSAATSCSSGRRRPGRSSSNAAVAVDPELTYVRVKTGAARGAGRARRGARRARARRGRAGPRPLPGRRAGRRALRAAVPVPRRPRVRRARAHRAAGGLRHRRRRHRPRAHGDRLRRGRLPPRRALRAERRQPGAARRHLRRAHRQVRRPLRQGRRRGPHRGPQAPRPRAARRGATSTPTRTAGAGQPAALLREADLVHRDLDAARPPASPPTRRSAGTRSTSSTGASATGWRTTSTGRSRASATGARRCRSGATRTATSRHRLLRRARGALGREASTDPHRPYVDDITFPSPQCSGKIARRVPEVIDVWFDSGAMPFAQWHAPFENAGRVRGAASRPTSSARRSTRRAAGSTRCSRSRCCCTTGRRTATSSASA